MANIPGTPYVDHASDVAEEYTNDALGGYDMVFSTVSHTLGFGMEYLRLLGPAISGTGNGNANTLYGTDANNVLSGLNGDDLLLGNGGNDQVLGGNGNDVLDGGSGNYLLNGGTGHDQLFGGTGVDTASYSGAGARVTVNLGLTTAQNTGGAGTDLLVDLKMNKRVGYILWTKTELLRFPTPFLPKTCRSHGISEHKHGRATMRGPSVSLLEIRLAQYAHDVDASSGSFEDHPIVAGS